MERPVETSEIIKQLRKQAGLTQKQLAEKAGLSIASIQGYEQGKYTPKIETLSKIAKALDVSVESLFGGITIGFMTEYDLEKLDYYGLLGDENLRKINELFKLLNYKGQDKAIEQVEMLTQIPKYQRKY